MSLLTGLFRFARKSLMTTDNDMGMFRDKLMELVDKKDTLSDEDIVSKVEEIKGFVNDLPDNEGKDALIRYLEDFKSVKEQDAAVAKKAAETVADQFEKLDTEAMQDVPGAGTTPPAQNEGVKEAETVVEKTVAPDEESKDADPEANAQYSLEEIYQFIKKRMSEDEATPSPDKDDTTEKQATDKDCEKDKDEVVTDHAPHIPVTVKDHAAKGSLSALFDMAKRGNK